MKEAAKPISVNILEREYVLACAETERDALLESVAFLNSKMREVRATGNIVGSERVAVLAALNIAHEYLTYKHRKDDYTNSVDAEIKRLGDKIAQVLSHQIACDH